MRKIETGCWVKVKDLKAIIFLICNEHVVVHMIPVSLGGTHQFPPVSDTVCFSKNHGCHWATERRRRNVIHND